MRYEDTKSFELLQDLSAQIEQISALRDSEVKRWKTVSVEIFFAMTTIPVLATIIYEVLKCL